MSHTAHPTTRPRHHLTRLVAAACALGLLSGCATTQAEEDTGRLKVVATTPLLADIARNVAGDTADVTALVPDGVDPHTYEPTLRAVRDVAHADLVLSNGLLLEQQALTRTLHATAGENTPVVAVAEDIPRVGGTLIPLIEDASLDTVWLGLRVIAAQHRTDTTSARMHMALTHATTPDGGRAVAYTTSTFGTPDIVFDSNKPGRGTTLPLDAHTHLSWAFTTPGYYSLTLAAHPQQAGNPHDDISAPRPEHPQDTHDGALAETTVHLAVGIDPTNHPALPGAEVIDHGHLDITADENTGTIDLVGDAPDGNPAHRPHLDPGTTVIFVPPATLDLVPPTPGYRFLGTPGDEIYLLKQAVVGKHIHGDTDPHAWMDPANGQAYAHSIADALASVAPSQRATFEKNASAYSRAIGEAGNYLSAAADSIPPAHRHLVTTHDGYAYLAKAAGLTTAGVVAPNPDQEPSTRDMVALTQALRGLAVPAVFIEPRATAHADSLTRLADSLGVKVCTIYGDTLAPDHGVHTYLDLITADADSLAHCLGPPTDGPAASH